MAAPRHSHQSGLSLLEILVCIGIIGVLAALLVPLMGRSREMAQSTKCVSNLRMMGMGALRYFSEHNGLLLPGKYWYYPSDTPVHSEGNVMRGMLEYLVEGADYRVAVYDDTLLTCPSIKTQHPRVFPSYYNRTYSVNQYAHAYGPKEQMITLPQPLAFPGTIYQIRDRSAMWLFMDGAVAPEQFIFTYLEVNMPFMANPHRGHSNAVFFDGHAEKVDPAKIKLPASSDFWGGLNGESL